MSDTTPPRIYVDLMQQQPQSAPDFYHDHEDEDIDVITAKYRAYLSRFQPWRVAIKSGDNERMLFMSSEHYFNETDARHAIELAFGTGSDVYLRQAEHGDQTLRLAAPHRREK